MKGDSMQSLKHCKNPLCSNILWHDRFRYGTGVYCDKNCSMEAKRFTNRTISKKKIPMHIKPTKRKIQVGRDYKFNIIKNENI